MIAFVMLFSPVLANGATEGSKHFLRKTKNLFNVAVTRARAHLIVVGDRTYCGDCGVDYLSRFVKYCDAPSESQRGPSVAGEPLPAPADVIGLLERLLDSNGVTYRRDICVDQYCVQFACEQVGSRIALEIDTSHAIRLNDPTLRRDDIARWERLSELGWQLMRFAPHEITEHPNRVLERLKAARREIPVTKRTLHPR